MKQKNLYNEGLPEDFLNASNKLFTSKIKKKKYYTEEEVKKLCNKAWIQAIKKSESPLTTMGFTKWFEQNKK